MADDPTEVERWHLDGRYYGVTLASGADAMFLELDDLAPSPSRGPVVTIRHDDATGALDVQTFIDEPLPLALIEQFITEARHRLPTSVKINSPAVLTPAHNFAVVQLAERSFPGVVVQATDWRHCATRPRWLPSSRPARLPVTRPTT